MKKNCSKILKTAVAAVVGATALGIAQPARADLTISGATGLPLNPTAQMQPRGSVRVQGNFTDLGSINGDNLNFAGIYAAGRVGDRLEVSGGLENLNGDRFLDPFDETNVALGAKYLIRQGAVNGDSGPSLATGLGYSRALLRNKHAYVVASQPFNALSASGRPAATAHLGVRYDDFDPLPGFLGNGKNKASLYGGLEVPTSDKLSIVGELLSKNSEFGTSAYPFSVGARYRTPERGFSATAGYLREGITGKSGFFAQIGKSF